MLIIKKKVGSYTDSRTAVGKFAEIYRILDARGYFKTHQMLDGHNSFFFGASDVHLFATRHGSHGKITTGIYETLQFMHDNSYINANGGLYFEGKGDIGNGTTTIIRLNSRPRRYLKDRYNISVEQYIDAPREDRGFNKLILEGILKDLR